MENKYVAMAMLRISIGFVFFWAFIDKLIGLGFSTCRDRATGEYLGMFCGKNFASGGSPTTGFITNTATADGQTFAWLFKPLVRYGADGAKLGTYAWLDWLFMIGLFAIGIALIFGAGMRLAAWAGSALLVLMWAAELPLDTNIIMDDHLIYSMALFVLLWWNAGDYVGLGNWWKNTAIVKKYPWLA